MKPKLSPLWGVLPAVLALVLVLGGTDTARAGSFNPTLSITVTDPTPEANSDTITDFNLPIGDVNFAGAVFFIPPDWGIPPGDEIAIGAVVGELTSTATLGIINGACNTALPVAFAMLNASTDPSDTVSYIDADAADDEGSGVNDVFEDKDRSGLADGIEKYPDFITRVLVDENDQPLEPLRRSAGITVVAGVNVLLQFLVFEPGTFINENIPNDEELGHPSVTLLQNIGDPDFDVTPGPITDFCTELVTNNVTFGISKDNACTDAVPLDQLDPICSAISGVILEGGGTDPDESGIPLSFNPQDGTHTFTVIALGQRDTDDDGFENSLDTCPFVANVGDPREQGDGDADSDGLDAACDPNDDETNSDQDLDGYLNRGDNCTLIANGETTTNQRDTDNDGIGDACDPNPDDAAAQGELASAVLTEDIVIGTGEGEGGPPTGFEGGADDDDGGGSTLIIIIIVVIAAVIVVGGGAFLLARRGGGGGGATA